MKMSEERQQKLYAAIADPITELRIKWLRSGGGNTRDDELFNLQHKIWRNVHTALNLDSDP
jgi:hypothetical protein